MHKKWNLTSFALLALHLCTALVFVLFSGGVANAAIISGTVYTDATAGTNVGAGKTIRLLINGASAGTNVTAAGGTYSITATLAAGNAIMVYIDGDATYKGSAVTISNGASLAALNIYGDHSIITRFNNGAGSLTNANMSTALGAYSDTDIEYTVPAGVLTCNAGTTLNIPSTYTFLPGGNVTTTHVKIYGTWTATGTETYNVGGDWILTLSGVFNQASSTINLTGTGIFEVDDPNWWTHQFFNVNAAAANKTTTIYASSGINVRNVLTLGTGTLTGGSVILSNSGGTQPSLVTAGATLSNSTFKYSGVAGPVIVPSAAFPALQFAPDGNVTYNLAGNISCTSLSIYGNSAALTSTLDTTASNYAITCNSLQIGSASTNVYGNLKLNNSVITINGDVTIKPSDAGGANTIVASTATLNVAGKWSNSDTFTAGTSSVILNGAALQNVTACSACASGNFNNLTITNASAAGVSFLDAFNAANITDTTPGSKLTFKAGANYNIAGTLTLTGTSASKITMLSDLAGTKFTLTPSSAQTVSYVNVKDSQSSTSDITANTSTNSGGNDDAAATPHWIFAADSCPVVTSVADSGVNTLRQCITYANSHPGTTISFNIATAANQNDGGGHSWWRIAPASALPTITAAGTIIDGSTQTTNIADANTLGPEIELNGASAVANGLTITGGTTTIRGLIIDQFTGWYGIDMSTNGGNTIVGNYIGLNATGISSPTKLFDCLRVNGTANNTIGGTTAADRNVISGATHNAISITGAGATGNVIKGNHLGTNATGTAAIVNESGVAIGSSATGNTVGGTAAGAGNLISGNSMSGVTLSSNNNSVVGNYIGTNAAGTGAVGNQYGIIISGATGNTVGGITAAHRNIISGNTLAGVQLIASAASNTVIGNYIGTTADGSGALGNYFGVYIISGAHNNTIGGTTSGQGNLIANSTGAAQSAGVYLDSAGTTANIISGNSIFSNQGLGIDIVPVGVGTGSGANNNKVRPIIAGITANGANFDITATVTSGDTVEFFRVNNAAAPVVTADSSGSGEGYLFLGSCVDNGACSGPYISGVTDANGTAGTVTITLTAAGVTNGDYVTATATDAANGTSEFAANMTVVPCPGGVVTSTAATGLGSLRECINFANSSTGTTISFNIPTADSGYQTSGSDHWWRISPTSALPTITANGTIIDGATQTTNKGDTNSKGPEIEINGAGAGAGVSGLTVGAVANVAIKQLVINSFNYYGVVFNGSSASQLYGSYVGVDALAGSGLGNGQYGVKLFTGATNIDIGGVNGGEGNWIAGNGAGGVLMLGSSNVRVRGNSFGVKRDYSARIYNTGDGIDIDGSTNVTVGGSTAGARNVISGSAGSGINVHNAASGITIQGNTIGSGTSGAESNLGNSSTGVLVTSTAASSDVVLGGVNTGEGNLIAYTMWEGIKISNSGTGDQVKGNTIRNNGRAGVYSKSDGVVIAKNLLWSNGNNPSFPGIDLLNHATTGQNNNKVYHNTIHGNTTDGILVEGLGAIIKNNSITGNGAYGINRIAAAMTEDHNLITDASTSPANTSGRSNVALAISDRNLAPKYVNAASGNFTLTECSSPAINAGTDLGVDQPDMNGPGVGNWTGILPDMGTFESSCSGANDIAIDGSFSDWDNGTGNEFCMSDQGGVDDWTSPAKLDITKYCIGSNLSDRFFILFGFDDTSFANDATACVLLDTDSPADNFINKVFCVAVNGTAVQSLTLYSCDNSIAGGCGGATVAKTYAASDYAIGTATGPFGGSDTFVEAQLPYADIGVALGNIVFTSMVTYPGGAFLKSPKDSIFGIGGKQNYNDRVQYDTAGIGAIQANASIPSVSGNVYTDEGTTPIGAGKTVHLLRVGVDGGTNTTDAGGGYYIQNASLAAGESILAYIDNDATYKGTTVSVFNSSNITDLDIYAGRVITRQDNAGSLSNASMSTAKGVYADTDIEYSVAAGALTVSGTATLYLPAGQSYIPGNTVTAPALKSLGTFNGGTFSDTISGTLTVAGGAYTASSGTTSVSGNFAITANCTISTGTIAVAGNVSSTAATVNGTASITLNGTGAQSITASAADLPNGTLTIDKSSGTASLAAALALASGGNVTVNQGTLDLTGYSLTGVTTLAANSGATLKLQGGETVTATTKTFNSGSYVQYNGAGTYASLAAGNTYSNLAFNNAAGSWAHTGALTTKDLTVSAGTLVSGGQNINLSGNWSNSGSYTSGANTVTFGGTGQSLTGNTTFNSLTKSVAAADTLTFAAGSTTTVNGTATINGASGQLLSLRSSSSPTKWNLNLGASSTKAISYLDVKDSDASGSNAAKIPVSPTSSVDSFNTVSWFGTPSLLVVKSASTGTAAPGTVVTFSIQVSNTGDAAATSVVLDSILSPFMALSLDAYGASQPFQLVDGAPPSLLALGAPTYSNNNGSSWVYAPAPAGYDGAVTNWKMPMTGSMGAGTSFILRYKGQVK